MSRRATVKIWIGIAVFVALTFFVRPELRADIYVYVDGEGVMHFTNAPTSAKYKPYLRERTFRARRWQNIRSYDDVIQEAARQYGLSFPLLKAMIHVESYFNPQAVSKKGAMGLMQIMPENLALLNISDPFDPWENIMGGARYLKSMLLRFDGQLSLALAAYNAGPTAVERYKDVPPYPETIDYVDKVMKFFHLYRES